MTKTKNLYSQINHTLQWYREVTYKNTTQHIHDKSITDTQILIHTIFTLQQEELSISQENI